MEKQLDKKIVEPKSSEWARPVLFVPKHDGILRFCAYYCRLNEATMADRYPLPSMDGCIDRFGDAAVLSNLDEKCGYWKIPIDAEDRGKPCFKTHMGTYRYKRMPFRLRNAPATLQRALEIVLFEVRWQVCLVYLDDVIVFSPTVAANTEHLESVLGLLEAVGITIKLNKCELFQEKFDHL